MSKFGGKMLAIYISPDGVRVIEGENKNGNPDIVSFFVVKGVSEYFHQSPSNNVPEIANMSGLVNAIVEECKVHHCTTRRVMVCSDCFGIHTVVNKDEGLGGLKSAMSGDIKDIAKAFSSKKKEPTPPGCMDYTATWGSVISDNKVLNVSTVSIGDKYMLRSLVQEFYRYGYEVILATGAQEILMNFRHTEQASFDSQGKVIVGYDVDLNATVFVKDIPFEMEKLPMVEEDSFLERLNSLMRNSVRLTGRNPRVYLTGSKFCNTRLYNDAIDMLEDQGFVVYDMFHRPDTSSEDYESKVASGEMPPVLTPDFSANIALLMCSHVKNYISLTPGLELTDVLKKNIKAIVLVGTVAAGVMFAGCLAMSIVTTVNLAKMSKNPVQLDSLQMQVTNAQMRQSSLNSTIKVLTEADTTILKLLSFVNENQSDRVAVVSVDTRDVLGSGLSVDSSGTTVSSDVTADETVSGEVGGDLEAVRENIVIRGYAKTGNEAVEYYDKLFKHGFSVDPVLNGVERYILPGGEEAFVFEIEIGGVLE